MTTTTNFRAPTSLPSLSDIEAAYERIQSVVKKTPVLTCATLNHLIGAELFFKCENFQKVGAFKMRGAANAVQAAIETYEKCLALRGFVSIKTLGSIYSNFGAVLYESGDLSAGLEYQERAVENFLIHGKPMNLSIAFCHKAMILLQSGEIDSASDATEKSIAFAQSDDYRRGLHMGQLLRAEVFARRQNKEAARRALTDGLAGFQKLGITEGLNFEFAARICRFVDDFVEAEEYARKGIEVSREFPLYLAALHFELALILKSAGKPFEDSAKEALELYRSCEALRQMKVVKNAFEIK